MVDIVKPLPVMWRGATEEYATAIQGSRRAAERLVDAWNRNYGRRGQSAWLEKSTNGVDWVREGASEDKSKEGID